MNKRADNGFSMVELLTVIAIIAILSAIIFPVMSSVKEKARQSTCITNLRQIGMAVSMFKADNRYFPVSLAPTYVAGLAMEDVRSQADCLYPEYIKSVQVFHCPNNYIVKNTNDPMAGSSNALYGYDSYDAHPGADTAITQYTRDWATIAGTQTAAEAVAAAVGPHGNLTTSEQPDSDMKMTVDYERQLKWRTPPGDTVIAWCMYHTTNPYSVNPPMSGKALVLFLDGHTDIIEGAIVRDSMWRTRPKK